MNDFTTKNGIETFLGKHSFYNFSEVRVFVQQGIVLMVGKVLTNGEKKYLENSLKRLPGVKKVISKLEISSESVTVKLPSLKSVLGIS
jgi:osmotically-inducible protein OsmY